MLLSNRIAFASIGAVLGLQVMFTYLSPFQVLFASAPLSFDTWWVMIGCGLMLLVAIEVEKWLRARRSSPPSV